MAVEIIGRGIRPQEMSLRKQWGRRKYDRVIEAKDWLEVILGSEGSVINVDRQALRLAFVGGSDPHVCGVLSWVAVAKHNN